MNYLKLKYIKYILLILFLYILFSIIIRIVNIYTLIFLIVIIYIFYNIDKKLFKKVVYKVIYKNKKNTLSFKNTYGAAKISLEGVEKISKKINDKVKVELLNYQKNKLESQLKTGDYKVTLFGAGSSGKTSIARSLLKNIVGQTSAKIGTTKQINSYKIRIPILKRNINIVDTPGLFEPSKIGEEREKATILQASNSDLVLFVLDQDINKYENYLIKELLKLRKKIIIVLNKCDLRSKDENNLIKENIISITSAGKNKISVVQTIAVPQQSPNIKSDALYLVPEVGSLFREIIETLDNNGEELLADNILFRSNKLGIKSKNFVQEQDSKVVGITAAMATGTGLDILQRNIPDQYIDVGIAEQHAVTLAAGMSCDGLKPVVAIYSTFLQRAFDQLIHDVGIQNLPVSFVLDRAGIVGADGPTHQGQYDISYMRSIPNFVLMAPKDESELQRMLITSINYNGPTALRIPRGSGLGVVVMDEGWEPLNIGEAEILEEGEDILIIAYGSMVASAIETAKILKNMDINACLINARFVKPLDKNLIMPLASRIQKVVTMEEGTLIGGFGSAIVELLNDNEINIPVYRIGIPDVLVDHASPDQSKEKLGLMPDQMADKIVKKFQLDN